MFFNTDVLMRCLTQKTTSSHHQPTGPTAWDDVVADEAAHVALRVVTALMPRTDAGGAPVSV